MRPTAGDPQDVVLRDVELDGVRVDLHVRAGRVAGLSAPGDVPAPRGAIVVAGAGGAVVPGLWDHHVHLLATAAAAASVPVGPPEVTDLDGLANALRTAPGTGWIRAVGYHDSVAGPLDRDLLDRVVPDRPVRVQHRSGVMWVLNGKATDEVGLDDPGGRLVRGDEWLRDRLPPGEPPDLAAVGRRLAGYGVVGVTDLTPTSRPADLDLLATAGLDQHVIATGGPELADSPFPAGVGRGPVKLIVDDHDPPALDRLADSMRRAHQAGRAVAVHCVSRLGLALALAAWDAAGAAPGDRVEHGAVVPPEVALELAGRGLTVVTQPSFVVERGDRYLAEVDPDDLPHLYPCASLFEAGVAVGGGTDAPYGHLDPWRAVAAAVERRTAGGAALGPTESIDARRALGLFLSPPDRPGGPPRRVEVGAPADLCLLDAPLEIALAAPSSGRVRATFVAGRPIAGALT